MSTPLLSYLPPWIGEPNELDWVDEETGLQCAIRRNGLGCLCGYVELPAGHIFFGLHRGEDITVPACVMDRPIDINKTCLFDMMDKIFNDERDKSKLSIAQAFNAHGGINYAGLRPMSEAMPRIEAMQEWWIGFDCGHSGDAVPGMIGLIPEMEKAFPELAEIMKFVGMDHYDTYRTIAYVQEECRSLAGQIMALHELSKPQKLKTI